MNLIRFLFGKARGLVLCTLAAASLSGACNAGLIAIVNYALNRGLPLSSTVVWGFVALGLGKLIANCLSQTLLARYSQDLIAGLRQELVQSILLVPLRRLEDLGAPRIMIALTEDIMHLAEALLMLPNFLVNLAILGGGAVYLGWLSFRVALAMSVFILAGAVSYRLLIANGFGYLSQAREEGDRLFSHFRALTEGIKELKLHRHRRRQFLSENVQKTTQRLSRLNFAAEWRFIAAHGWSQSLFLALVGLILFLLPNVQSLPPGALTGYVVTTLYLMGPLTGVLGSLSAFARADLSLRKIEQLGFLLAADGHEVFRMAATETPRRFERLELIGVTHSYHRENEDSHFLLGPISLALEPGEVVFLVGGNGSGKSTLAKLVTGLYPPESGHVRLNGKPVTAQDRDDYRQMFSAVFSDFYLFESLLGLECAHLDRQAREYLSQLHLNHKVTVTKGTLSTTALSQGQRKRLALLTAYLEDRPLYVFDEWASDQDPQFKEIFYYQVLPELKARNKAVLVITHDDGFFHVADRILKLDYGRVIYEKRSEAPAFESVLNGESLVST